MFEDRSVTADQDVLEVVRRVLADPRHIRVQSGLIGFVANSPCKFHECLTICPMSREESVAARIAHPDSIQDLTEGAPVDDGLANLDHERLDGFHLLTAPASRAKPSSLRAQDRRGTHKASYGAADPLPTANGRALSRTQLSRAFERRRGPSAPRASAGRLRSHTRRTLRRTRRGVPRSSVRRGSPGLLRRPRP